MSNIKIVIIDDPELQDALNQHGKTKFNWCELHINCLDCNVKYIVTVPGKAIVAWNHGYMVQDAFPGLSVDQRELLVSGYCGACFDTMFGSETLPF